MAGNSLPGKPGAGPNIAWVRDIEVESRTCVGQDGIMRGGWLPPLSGANAVSPQLLFLSRDAPAAPELLVACRQRKRASYPQFLEVSNSGVKVSDPDYRLPQKRLLPCVCLHSDSSHFAEDSPRRPLLCRAPRQDCLTPICPTSGYSSNECNIFGQWCYSISMGR